MNIFYTFQLFPTYLDDPVSSNKSVDSFCRRNIPISVQTFDFPENCFAINICNNTVTRHLGRRYGDIFILSKEIRILFYVNIIKGIPVLRRLSEIFISFLVQPYITFIAGERKHFKDNRIQTVEPLVMFLFNISTLFFCLSSVSITRFEFSISIFCE